MIASEASCPTPEASCHRLWGKRPRVKDDGGYHEYGAIENLVFQLELTIFCILRQPPKEEFREIPAQIPTLEPGKVFTSAGASGCE